MRPSSKTSPSWPAFPRSGPPPRRAPPSSALELTMLVCSHDCSSRRASVAHAPSHGWPWRRRSSTRTWTRFCRTRTGSSTDAWEYPCQPTNKGVADPRGRVGAGGTSTRRTYLPVAFLRDEDCRMAMLTNLLGLTEIAFDGLFSARYNVALGNVCLSYLGAHTLVAHPPSGCPPLMGRLAQRCPSPRRRPVSSAAAASRACSPAVAVVA